MIANVDPSIVAAVIALSASIVVGGFTMAYRFGLLKQKVEGLQDDLREVTKGLRILTRAVYSMPQSHGGGTSGHRLESDE